MIALLEEERIRFIPRDANPPPVASHSPIEDYWSALKKAVYSGGWEAEDIEALKRRISAKVQSLLLKVIQNLFRTVKDRMRTCAEKGYLAVHR